jgi:hypothetical protein
MINNGLTIQILCDAPVDPVSVRPSTCFVTVDLPYPQNVLFQTSPTAVPTIITGFHPLVLPCQVSAKSSTDEHQILCTIAGTIISTLFDILNTVPPGSRLLTHVTLKRLHLGSQ